MMKWDMMKWDIWYLDRIIGHTCYRPVKGDKWFGMEVVYVHPYRNYAVVKDVEK